MREDIEAALMKEKIKKKKKERKEKDKLLQENAGGLMKKGNKNNSNTKIKSELCKEKTYSQKNHRLYENNLKSSNPFVGLSHYDKNTKERKNLIAKTIQKEGDEYNYINLFEENISKKKDLNDDDLNKFIILLSSFLFGHLILCLILLMNLFYL